MNGLIRLAVRFFNDEGGATAIEYGLIAGGLSIVILAVVSSIGSGLVTTFTTVSTKLEEVGN